MVEFEWPDDLAPYRCMFYLQPHVGGSESPLTRVRKTYGLSAPRWIARLTFRGGYKGAPVAGEHDGFGPRLDSLIADLQGGLNLVWLHDWRRPRPTRPLFGTGPVVAEAAPTGATFLRIGGLAPRAVAFGVGDYVGGDGRPHLVSLAATRAAGGAVAGVGSVMADAMGVAIVGINPPLSAPVPAGARLTWPVTGRFQLVSEDAGENETEVGGLTGYALDFAEHLG